MNPISNIDKSINKISLNREPLQLRLQRRDPSFAERLDSAVKDVNSKQHLADDATQGVMKDEVGIHEGMLAIGRADTSLRLLMQVKSKAMEAYKEIINMQL
ncbi:MAG: flagellar hook-basal body complex protein FliE [Desulfamplus sp.]|nr:flagellar hook-basal body complex protein FliE [Desulfamplus sp.]MBF0210861.1 flagellar hook-basal body complex protein FliE [Desulfamplus sp.]MBF0241805.1 flagellar hook-basal body complex protein FliE [Desulfamplus sp.]MBF0390446.1 flagellar hook-basal body complex protein FliE [Desulfamplus sp.]